MAKPTEDFDYLVYRADSVLIKLAFFDLNRELVNLSVFNLRFTLRDEYENQDSVIQKTRISGVPNGIYLSVDNQAIDYNLTEINQMAILLDSDNTKVLRSDIFPFDVEFSKIDKVYTAIRGNLIFRKDMTRNA